jgi:hypothetical protein
MKNKIIALLLIILLLNTISVSGLKPVPNENLTIKENTKINSAAILTPEKAVLKLSKSRFN